MNTSDQIDKCRTQVVDLSTQVQVLAKVLEALILKDALAHKELVADKVETD